MLGVLTDSIDEYFRLKPYSADLIPLILYLHDTIFKEFEQKTLSPIMKKKLDEVKYPVSELIHVDERIR